MKRYNMFNQIHKGLRAMLYETGLLLLHTDFAIADEAVKAMEQLTELLELFDKHADTEDYFVLPLLEQFEPSVSCIFEEEHVQDHALSNKLRKLHILFQEADNEYARTETGSAIRVSFVEFMVFNLDHMAKEENVINHLLWKYQTDEQLRQVTQQILAKIGPAEMFRTAKWMMRGLNNTEIIIWLNEVKANAPGFVFNNLMEILDAELPEQRKQVIMSGVGAEIFA